MSTLNVANITDGTDTVETGYVVSGSAKVWIQFSSIDNPSSISGSFNVSSLTDGNEVEVNLTSAMSDAFFAPVGNASATTTNPANRNLSCSCKTSSVLITEVYSTSNTQVTALCHLAAHGDLA